jgi:hypothetical protein
MSAELGERLLKCPRFRWMPGMLCLPGRTRTEGGRYLGEDPPGTGGHNVGFADGTAAYKVNSWPPDLSDPATLGCLLALVREAWGCDDWRRLTIEPAGAGWCIAVRNGRHRPPSRARPLPGRAWEVCMGARGLALCATEAEALVAALEAAP